MSILESLSKSERTALVMLERRDAREKIRITGLLGECIALAKDWTNTGSKAWFYVPTVEAGHSIVAAARAAGFRVVRLFATLPNGHALPFTVTVETEPMQLDGPRNLATSFSSFSPNASDCRRRPCVRGPVACSTCASTLPVMPSSWSGSTGLAS
jgi:hypothetical protein